MIFRVVVSTSSECKERHVRESKIVDSRSVNVSMVDQHVSIIAGEVAVVAVDMVILSIGVKKLLCFCLQSTIACNGRKHRV